MPAGCATAWPTIEGVRLYCADMDRDHLPVFVFNIDGLPADQAGSCSTWSTT